MIATLDQSPIIIDGGTGTELERLGVPMNSKAWSAEAVLSHPHVLQSVHEAFLDAGADVIIANTFSAGLHNLQAAGLGDRFTEVNRNAVQLARAAMTKSGHDGIVAGGISTTTFSGALDTSRLLSGDAAVAQYARQAAIQVDAGADCIILEMMRDIEQTGYALEGAVLSGVPVWTGFTCFLDENDEPLLLDTDIPLQRALQEIDLSRSNAVGIMHTLVEHAPAAVRTLASQWDGPMFAYPHAGYFNMPNWIFQDATTPDSFAKDGLALFEMGVHAVGGCCGITPAHIRALSNLIKDQRI